ncbi:MAG: selenide, water dikinase SelD [Cyclobacteriaceae bacterium]|nr:selenide, water dikinase SelD [Cyclobacteriaceae bacterium]
MNSHYSMEEIKLTRYSHGAGCGCKISPKLLDDILKKSDPDIHYPSLLVGNDTRDDAAVFAIDEKRAIISTTDFFMPIVDDPFDFGVIASVNAISDIYAMGGKPLMAISILGWPVDKIGPEIAQQVLEGARDACRRAGIPLAGGHSIDTPEPIFGLAVTGTIDIEKIKSNSKAIPGCELYLTKPLGTGILTTAQKKGLIRQEDLKKAIDLMVTLNDIGCELSELGSVRAMTDVTGFGLLGHLAEMCEGSGVSAEIFFDQVPLIPGLGHYTGQNIAPGGTERNYRSYGHRISQLTDEHKIILCDPQTSGGLLVAVDPAGQDEFRALMEFRGLTLQSFGKIIKSEEHLIRVIPAC